MASGPTRELKSLISRQISLSFQETSISQLNPNFGFMKLGLYSQRHFYGQQEAEIGKRRLSEQMFVAYPSKVEIMSQI